MTHEEALLKVQKLLKLTASSNVNEAASAAARAQEIMDRFGIEKAAAELAGTEGQEPILDHGKSHDSALDGGGRVERWRVVLGMGMATANGCMLYSSRKRGAGGKMTTLELIGRPSDVGTVRYLYDYAALEIEGLAKAAGAGLGRTWNSQFKLGAAQAVVSTMEKQRQATLAAVRAETDGSSTALMRVDQAIAKVERKLEEVNDWQKLHLKLGKASSFNQARVDMSARQEGYRAGSKIQLSSAKGQIGGAQKQLNN